MIRIRGLHKRFGKRVVLRGITAEALPGETVALIGPSGGGKSTLLRCLNYLTPFDEGSIEIAGFSLKPHLGRESRGMIRELRAAVGMVFQEFNLFPHLTVLENITLAARVVRGVSKAEADSDAHALLDKMALGDRADCYPSALSGGQKQRVAIARALAQKPRVLLFDEPTSALDSGMQNEVLGMLRALAGRNLTIMVVTHDNAFASRLGGPIWALDDGLLENGIRPAAPLPLTPFAIDRVRLSRA